MTTSGRAGKSTRTEAEAGPRDDVQELRQEIEQTREQLGETVEQLVAKADLKGRAQAQVSDRQVVAEAMIKLLYKPLGMLVSVLGGILGGAIFKQAWKLAAGEDEAPQATDARRGWIEVLLAAALQGAIFAVVKAAVDRGAATGVEKVTGVWPGDEAEAAGDGSQENERA